MFIATTTPDAQPSSVGAAWMVVVALRLGESGGAPAYEHAAPMGLGEPGCALGYKHVAPMGLCRHAADSSPSPPKEERGKKPRTKAGG